MIKGATWRQEQAALLSVREAWFMAALTRGKKLPSLKSLMRSRAEPQSPQAVRSEILAWAAGAKAAGLPIRITRHEKPVM